MRWITYTFGITTALLFWGAGFYVLSHPEISRPGGWFFGACIYSILVFVAILADINP